MVIESFDYFLFGAVCILILIDIISGAIKGLVNHNFKSAVMRVGLWHKMGEILLIGTVYIAEIIGTHADIGYTGGIATAACVYVIVMELASIFENIREINPNLSFDFLKVAKHPKDGE